MSYDFDYNEEYCTCKLLMAGIFKSQLTQVQTQCFIPQWMPPTHQPSSFVMILMTQSKSNQGIAWLHVQTNKSLHSSKAKKKNCYVALTRPKFKNWVGRSGFFFFFFLRTVRELSFPIFFLKFLNGENSGGMQSKRIYKSCKCFFKPLNTNFSKFFAQIWHKKKKKKKKKNATLFFRILRSVGRGQHNNFFFWP